MDIQKRTGKIEVAPKVIATLAARAVEQSYGVIGLASPRLRHDVAELLSSDEVERGIEVKAQADQVVIELYVVLQYGVRITEVAHNIQSAVRFAVSQSLGGLPVVVNVNVQGLRVSEADQVHPAGGAA